MNTTKTELLNDLRDALQRSLDTELACIKESEEKIALLNRTIRNRQDRVRGLYQDLNEVDAKLAS